eukprot:3678217-Rhodomonas_salina.1
MQDCTANPTVWGSGFRLVGYLYTSSSAPFLTSPLLHAGSRQPLQRSQHGRQRTVPHGPGPQSANHPQPGMPLARLKPLRCALAISHLVWSPGDVRVGTSFVVNVVTLTLHIPFHLLMGGH